MCDGDVAVLSAVASPKFHEYRITSPLGSTVPTLLVSRTSPMWDVVKVTVGATLVTGSVSSSTLLIEADLPQPSVVVSVTV